MNWIAKDTPKTRLYTETWADVSEAKSMESAKIANKLVSDTLKGINEAVHLNGTEKQKHLTKKQRDLKIISESQEPETCHWCGGTTSLPK